MSREDSSGDRTRLGSITKAHLQWLQQLTMERSALSPEDRLVFREYHALLMYKLL